MEDVPSRRSRLPGRLFGAATDGTSSATLFALMAMTCVDVAGREIFGAPLDGATELTQIMMGIIVFAVLPLVSLHERHITVDLLDRWFPQRLTGLRRRILNLAAGVIMAAVCWRVWVIGAYQSEYGDATEFLAIPLGPVSYFISAMSGIAAVALLANALRRGKPAGPSAPA